MLSPSKRALLWPFVIAGLIFLASSRSEIAGPQLSGTDKAGHFLIYGLLATLIARNGRGWRGAVVAIVLASAYGVTDEWHQSFTPGRSVELADWVADTLGAVVAVGLYSGVPVYRRTLETPLGQLNRRIEKPAQPTPMSAP